MRVFQFIDSETTFIAARDEAEAMLCYRRDMLGDGLEDDVPSDLKVSEIPREKWSGIGVRDSDDGANVEAIVGRDPERDAYVVCSTVCG